VKKKNSLFQKYYSRMVLEGVLKALLFGITLGFAVNFLTAAISWFVGFENIWLSIGLGLGSAACSGTILYFLKFRPDSDDIARRLDRLGLEERMITMLEFEQDESYIALRQRDDAKIKMEETPANSIRFKLSRLMIVFIVLAAVLGSGMTTVVGLAEEGIIPGGDDIIAGDPLKEYIAVSYVVEEGGEIEGESDQLILPGSDATPVTAVAIDGWMFKGWDDGWNSPYREHDKELQKSVTFTAIFIELEDGDGSDTDAEDGQGNGDPEGDKADDLPDGGEANVENGEPGQGEDGNGDGDSGNSDGAQGSGEDKGEGKGDGQGAGAGGKWSDSNQIIDGETYYQQVIESYYEMAMQILAEGGEIPEELREFIEKYYDSI
jgi:hypothetical protein